MGQAKSLCWDCKHSCPSFGEKGCCWCEHSEPVPGWDAIRHHRPQNGKKHEYSYFVKSCPGFVQSTNEDKLISEKAGLDATISLSEAMFDSCAKSYISYLNAFNQNPCAYTREELINFERTLKTGILKNMLPGKLTIEAYITHMRELYLSKICAENLQFKHTI